MAVHSNNVTVPEAVRQILTRNYPIYQCLKMKLTNFHAIAEYIQPQVQELTGRKTTINTLVVAIKRFSDTLGETKTLDTAKALANLRISLSGDVADVTVKVRRPDIPKKRQEFSNWGGKLPPYQKNSPQKNSTKKIPPQPKYNLIKT